MISLYEQFSTVGYWTPSGEKLWSHLYDYRGDSFRFLGPLYILIEDLKDEIVTVLSESIEK